MFRLAVLALFGWAAYRIMEENRSGPYLLPPPADDSYDLVDDEADGDDAEDDLFTGEDRDEAEPEAPRRRRRRG